MMMGRLNNRPLSEQQTSVTYRLRPHSAKE